MLIRNSQMCTTHQCVIQTWAVSYSPYWWNVWPHPSLCLIRSPIWDNLACSLTLLIISRNFRTEIWVRNVRVPGRGCMLEMTFSVNWKGSLVVKLRTVSPYMYSKRVTFLPIDFKSYLFKTIVYIFTHLFNTQFDTVQLLAPLFRLKMAK